MLNQIKKDLREFASKKRAKVNAYYFKTGKGDYGEGDKFIGISVPNTRKVAKKFKDISLSTVKQLLQSKIHEERLCALLILVQKYQQAEKKKPFVDFYLKNLKQVNNWDLVDITADKILGDYLINRSRKKLYTLAKSKHLWTRRVSIISTFAFIKNNDFRNTLKLSHILLKDEHDLMHKALVGCFVRLVRKKRRP